jgi:NitT/TauT family transport system ATP-binding protein
MAKITINSLNKRFSAKSSQQHIVALNEVNLTIEANEFVTVVGASGCGKSTLLRIVAGLESANSGDVKVDDRPIKGPGRDRAMIFQDYALYPWMTIIDNIRCSRLFAANTRHDSLNEVASALDRATALMQLMDLDKVKDFYPNQLSGGMQQRVAIARALLSKPDVLLMDEPFGALDAQTREVMHELLLHLFRVEKSTILFVTHDVEEAIYLADRVVVMAPNPGRIEAVYKVPLAPSHQRVASDKLSPEFLQLKQHILATIRSTSQVQMDLSRLKSMTSAAN